MQNNREDNWSPCLTPLEEQKYPLGEPLTKIEMWEEDKMFQTQVMKFLGEAKVSKNFTEKVSSQGVEGFAKIKLKSNATSKAFLLKKLNTL